MFEGGCFVGLWRLTTFVVLSLELFVMMMLVLVLLDLICCCAELFYDWIVPIVWLVHLNFVFCWWFTVEFCLGC